MEAQSSTRSLPSAPVCHLNVARVIEKRAVRNHGANEGQVRQLLACLNNAHLVSLLRLRKARVLPLHPSNKNFRSLFYRNASSILGWGAERREEESGKGFSQEVYDVLWLHVWPNVSGGSLLNR